MICSPWNTLHMSNTCQESIENSSMKTWRPTVLWPKVKSHTRVPYLSSLGLMCNTGQREREKGEYWRDLLEKVQHLRQTHDAKKKNAFKTNKKDNPCWGYKQSGEGIGAEIHQLQLFQKKKKLRKRTFKLKEALLGRSEPDYLWTRKDWLTRRGESFTNSKWRVKI